MIGAVKNAALAAGGIVVGEKLGGMVAGRVPGFSDPRILAGAMAVGGSYLGSRGGVVGKVGYGLAIAGLLRLVGSFMPGVDVNFND